MVTGTGAARRARAIAAGSAWVMAAGGARAGIGCGSHVAGRAAAAVLPTIDVTGRPTARRAAVGLRTTAGTKTDTPVAEIPQTINLVTAQQIEMTGATDLNQALRYVPGFATFGADSRTDWYALRGFTPTLYVDGVAAPNTAVIANWRVDPYTIDSIAALRGPTSVLYGAGGRRDRRCAPSSPTASASAKPACRSATTRASSSCSMSAIRSTRTAAMRTASSAWHATATRSPARTATGASRWRRPSDGGRAPIRR